MTTLLAFELSGSAALAGLAASASAFGAGLSAAAIGASARFGRRPGLVAGYLVGVAGAIVAPPPAVDGGGIVQVIDQVVDAGGEPEPVVEPIDTGEEEEEEGNGAVAEGGGGEVPLEEQPLVDARIEINNTTIVCW